MVLVQGRRFRGLRVPARAGGCRFLLAAILALGLICVSGVSMAGPLAAGPGPFAAGPGPLAQGAQGSGPVLVCRVSGTIDLGLARFLGRVVNRAGAEGRGLLLEIDSTGGRVDAALSIRDALLASRVPVVTYVSTRAWSAAALVAMAGDALIMAPGGSIGAAEPIPLTVKTLSAVRGEFEATAEAKGRDSLLAAAMVDSSVVVPGFTQGRLLVMTAAQATERGFSDGTAATRGEALELAGLPGAPVLEVGPSPAEQAARFVTHPAVAPVLLTIGLVALVIEILAPGFGVAGLIGFLSLGLFFGGHLLAGFGGWEVAALFILGIVLLLIEVFVPGFGVFGMAGIAAIIGSVFLATKGSTDALRSMAIAMIASLLLSVVVLRVAVRRGWLARLVLRQSTTTGEGFVARADLAELVGQSGETTTMLRPVGTARIKGRLVDVVTEGVFVPPGTRIRVTKVEGPRVVVAPAPRRGEKHDGGNG